MPPNISPIATLSDMGTKYSSHRTAPIATTSTEERAVNKMHFGNGSPLAGTAKQMPKNTGAPHSAKVGALWAEPKTAGNAALIISSPPKDNAADIITAAKGGMKEGSKPLTHLTALNAPKPETKTTAAQARLSEKDEVPPAKDGARAARHNAAVLAYLLMNIAPRQLGFNCAAVHKDEFIGKLNGGIGGIDNSS